MKRKFILGLVFAVALVASSLVGLSACGETPTKPHEHAYKLSWAWASDYSSATATASCDCGKSSFTENATISDEVTDPTCTEDGQVILTATAQLNGATYTDVKTIALPAQHIYLIDNWNWAGDFSSATATASCVLGDSNITEDATISVDNSSVSCTEGGEKIYTATVVLGEQVFEDYQFETVSAPGHSYGAGNICTHCGSEKPKISEGLTFDYTNEFESSYMVTGIGTCTDTEIYIPSTYNDMPVDAIGFTAFKNCTNITSVVIPDSVVEILGYDNDSGFVDGGAFADCTALESVTIGNGLKKICAFAFMDCSNLKNINLPDGLLSIERYAFWHCTSLKTITIPDSVSKIGKSAFAGCSALENMTLPFVGGAVYDTPRATSLFGYIFDEGYFENSTQTKQYYGTGTRDYKTYYIPDGLKEVTITGGAVMWGAFYDCSNLTKVTIGNNVSNISSHAFSGCSGLQELTLPYIGFSVNANAVYESGLFGYIFGTRSYIGGSATKHNSLTSSPSFYIPNSLTKLTITGGEIGNGVLSNCTNLTDVVISSEIEYISVSAFAGCDSLKSVTLPSTLIQIAAYAFENCSVLATLSFKGTIAQWSAVEKLNDWNAGAGDFDVICTDGTVGN